MEVDAPPLPSKRFDRIVTAVFVGACIAAAIILIVFPAYSNYDTIYSLVWGREIWDGQLPSFDGYRAPTEHPLWLAISFVLTPFGDEASRLFVAITVFSFLAFALGIYRLGRASLGAWVGVAGALLIVTRLDFIFFAARAYLDVPFIALLVWAGALEAEKKRRGGIIWLLLVLAGLLRPEAWLFTFAYLIWMVLPVDWCQRLRYAVYAAVAPIIWFLTDFIVTGDPLYSLNYTTGLAERLGRRKGLIDLPATFVETMIDLLRPALFVVGVIGLILALLLARKRLRVPLALFIGGVITWLGTSLKGFAVVDRYLLTASVMLVLFAGYAITGFTTVEGIKKGVERLWIVLAVLAVAVGSYVFLARFHPKSVVRELRLRVQLQQDIRTILDDPRVKEGLRCGPLSVPNHKLVPDVSWIAGSSVKVVPRSEAFATGNTSNKKGVAIYVIGGKRMVHHPGFGPFDQLNDPPLIQVPGPGERRVLSTRWLAAYVKC